MLFYLGGQLFDLKVIIANFNACYMQFNSNQLELGYVETLGLPQEQFENLCFYIFNSYCLLCFFLALRHSAGEQGFKDGTPR